MLHEEGSLARTAPERVSLLRFSRAGGLLACQSAGKALELFRCDWTIGLEYEHAQSHAAALSEVLQTAWLSDAELAPCRLRSDKEARKHMQRRKKRKREKAPGEPDAAAQQQQAAAAADGEAPALVDDGEEAAPQASDLLAPLQVMPCWLLSLCVYFLCPAVRMWDLTWCSSLLLDGSASLVPQSSCSGVNSLTAFYAIVMKLFATAGVAS